MAFHSDVLCDKATVWHASAVNYCIIVEQIFENMFKLKCYDTAQENGLICKKNGILALLQIRSWIACVCYQIFLSFVFPNEK